VLAHVDVADEGSGGHAETLDEDQEQGEVETVCQKEDQARY
jgi:hypothetical protein